MKTEDRGCAWLLLYFLLSYPLNWLYLRYVYMQIVPVPMDAGDLGFHMFMSPVVLPIEMLISLVFSIYKVFHWFGGVAF